MEYIVQNFDDIIMTILSISGEISEKYLIENINEDIIPKYADNYIVKKLNTLNNKDKVINIKEYKYNPKEKYIRLCTINGEKKLSDTSDELLLHFNLIAGDKNHRYSGDAARQLRSASYMKLILSHINDGIKVDFMNLKYVAKRPFENSSNNEKRIISHKSIFSGNELLKAKQIIYLLESKETCYLTSKALKRLEDNDKTLLSRTSQYYGLLCQFPNFYLCYFIQSKDSTWQGSEITIKAALSRYIKSNFGENASINAIFYLNDKEVYRDFFLSSQVKSKNIKNGSKIKPTEYYDKGYILPMSENYKDIREVLLLENGPQNLTRCLMGDNRIEGKHYDGLTEGLVRVYDITLSEYGKITRIKEEENIGNILLVIQKWQVEFVRSYFGEDVKYVEVSEEEFKEAIDIVKEENK